MRNGQIFISDTRLTVENDLLPSPLSIVSQNGGNVKNISLMAGITKHDGSFITARKQ